ncbi:iron chelate uptake ABC transporter family permease subunit [Kitasatospora sp. NBC_01287]|uniref:FecCD family ABC transporter permease n=1 Tax=Kitasatospora sp. NBC_01287 TaxID=2903573 RepID=UPI00225B7E57|nr:iron chelate uptake ABC transporter family permease subunit [Kitasatospora sp. NBC_01287]MCX4751584.1 iron chelate uptake ABC transporter family permease subunit [Kitasatospora sp. NBC_01287]
MSTIRLGDRWSLRYSPRALAAGTGCALLALLVSVLSLGSGEYPISPADVLRTLAGGGSPAEDLIVNQLRLPRVVTALLVGAALALAGALFQSLVRNPLGSPDVLGFTQGAATGALLVVVAGGSSLALATGAVIGGVATGAGVCALAWRGGLHSGRLILIGIGTAAILTGVNGYLLTRTKLLDAARAVLWLTGSLDGRGWGDAVPLLVALGVLGPLVLLGCGRALRMLELGDDTAAGLGVRVEPLRLGLLAAAVLLASLAAAAAGPVSFVALIAPQLARRLTRSPGPNLLAALCTGAALLVSADWAAQRLISGHQLPVGVVTGVLGGGYLVRLLATERRAGRI